MPTHSWRSHRDSHLNQSPLCVSVVHWHILLTIYLRRFIESEATTGRDATFFKALAFDHELGATQGIDAALKEHNLDALVLPAPGFTTVPAAIAGYPIVTGALNFSPTDMARRPIMICRPGG